MGEAKGEHLSSPSSRSNGKALRVRVGNEPIVVPFITFHMDPSLEGIVVSFFNAPSRSA